MWAYRGLYLLCLPGLVAVVLFNYIPMYGITIAFRDIRWSLGPYRSPWASPLLENFWILKHSIFWQVLANTVKIAALKFVFYWPTPIVLALLLNEVRVALRRRALLRYRG